MPLCQRRDVEPAPTMHAPSFAHEGLQPGQAFCVKCQRVISLADFVRETCPGKAAA